jgi:hypothetical protein
MANQVRNNLSTQPFILNGIGAVEPDGVLLTDAGRSTPLARYTVMAKVAASQKWVPFTLETATNGSAIPQGIYMGDEVTAAALVAGDVVDAPILVGAGVFVDKNQLVIENSKTLDTVITDGTRDLRTVKDHLATRGIFTEDTVDISGYENA